MTAALRFASSAALMVVLASNAGAAPPPLPTGPLSDWPCDSPREAPVDAQLLHAEPQRPGDWRSDARVRAVVMFAAAPENGPRAGEVKIAALAAGSANPRDALLLALRGIVDQASVLRGFIMEGIGGKVVKSRLLAEKLRSFELELTALPADAPAAARRALDDARDWTRRALGDNAEDAELLCRRFDYIAAKTETLARTIADRVRGS